MLDLSKLDTGPVADAGAVMEVRHPVTQETLKDANDKIVTITLAGKDSSFYKKAQRRITNRRLKANRGMGAKLTAEELEQEGIELLASCVLGWSGLGLGDTELECNFQNAKMLLTRLPWLREQCDAFIEDRANFLQD